MADELQELIEKRIDRFESAVIVALRKVTANIARKLGLVITADADAAAISPDDLANINAEWSVLVDTSLGAELAGIFVDAASTVPVSEASSVLYSAEAAQAAIALTTTTYQQAAAVRMYGIGQELWTNARVALLAGIQAGEGIPKIQKRVKDAVGVSESWARVIARTEVVSAANAGSFSQAQTLAKMGVGPNVKRWVATHDARTRPTHAAANGQQVSLDTTFQVGGVGLRFPGDPLGPASETYNCRCTLVYDTQPAELGLVAAPVQEDPAVDVELEEVVEPTTDPDPRFVAVLVPEGVKSGDGRMFAEGSLVWRDLPLPLSWQKASAVGHDNSVVVGKITDIWRDGNLVKGRGVYDLESEEGREANRLRHEEYMKGVSVDVDDVSDSDLELVWPEEEPEGEETDELLEAMVVPELMVWHHGRIMGATQVAHPAFQEALIGPDNGEAPPESVPAGETEPEETEELVAAAEPPSGAMIALVPTEEDAIALALDVEGALAADDLHITLWYLGDADLIEPETRQALIDWVGMTAGEIKPMELNAFAAAAFNPNEDPCVVLQMGGHPIAEARDLLTPSQDLFDLASVMQHEPFCAHLTLAYTEDVLGTLELAMAKLGPVGFNRVRIAFAGENTDFELGASEAITASAAAEVDPGWFRNPGLTAPTPWTVTDDGRCFGHLALDNTCHVGIAGTCVTPPKDDDGSYFATGEVALADGSRVAVGQVTFGTGHAPTTLGAQPSKTHYDNTGYCGADVAIGRDRFGTWVAGAVRPWVMANSDKLRELRAAGISGDWRKIGNRLRIMAVLAVNVPGFPVPRPQSRIQNGTQTAMVAAGMVVKSRPNLESAFEAIAASIGRDKESMMEAMVKEIHG